MAVDNNYSLDIVHCLELSNNDISHAGTFTIIRLTTSYGITLFVVRPEMDGLGQQHCRHGFLGTY